MSPKKPKDLDDAIDEATHPGILTKVQTDADKAKKVASGHVDTLYKEVLGDKAPKEPEVLAKQFADDKFLLPDDHAEIAGHRIMAEAVNTLDETLGTEYHKIINEYRAADKDAKPTLKIKLGAYAQMAEKAGIRQDEIESLKREGFTSDRIDHVFRNTVRAVAEQKKTGKLASYSSDELRARLYSIAETSEMKKGRFTPEILDAAGPEAIKGFLVTYHDAKGDAETLKKSIPQYFMQDKKKDLRKEDPMKGYQHAT